MKQIRPIRLIAVGLTAMLWFSGCDGGSSSSGGGTQPGVKTAAVGGFVEDPAIQDAMVELFQGEKPAKVCGPNGNTLCRTTSDENGSFSFKVKKGAEEGLIVVATGGTDAETGVSLGEIELRARLDDVKDKDGVAVTPVTTLVALHVESGETAEKAHEEVRAFLGLADDADLTRRPMGQGGEKILQRSMVLTRSALELKRAGKDKPFAALQDTIDEGDLVGTNGKIDQDVLKDAGLSEEKTQEISDLNDAVAEGGSASEVVKKAKKATLTASLFSAMKQMPGDADTEFDTHKEQYRKNAKILAEELLKKDGMVIDGIAVQRIYRHVIWAYSLLTIQKNEAGTGYEVTGPMVEGDLTPAHLTLNGTLLSQDAKLGALVKAVFTHEIKEELLANELLGNDNEKRLAYYYKSNASHLVKAESLLGRVYDDNVNDMVQEAIVAGNADAGFFDMATSIIESRMYLIERKASAWLQVAGGYIRYGKNVEAKKAIDKAVALTKENITNKGEANISNNDGATLQSAAAAYRAIDLPDEAKAITDYMYNDIQPALLASFGGYARFLMSIRGLTDRYLGYETEDPSAVDLAAGKALLAQYHHYASDMPENDRKGEKYYKMRVMSLCDVALRYAFIGDKKQVEEIVSEIEALRKDDKLISHPNVAKNLTKEKTWTYVDFMVEALAKVGSRAKAEALIATIPDDIKNADGYRSDCYAVLVDAIALEADVAPIVKLVDEKILGFMPESFPDITISSRVNALTLYNKHKPHAGMILAQKGYLDEAVKVTEHAMRYVNASYRNNPSELNLSKNKVQFGYNKCAKVFHKAGDIDAAIDALEHAENVLLGGGMEAESWTHPAGFAKEADGSFATTRVTFSGLTDVAYLSSGLESTVGMWFAIGEQHRALSLIREGERKLEKLEHDALPAPLANAYHKLGSAALEGGEKELSIAILKKGFEHAQQIFTDQTPDDKHDDALKAQSEVMRFLGNRAFEAGDMAFCRRLYEKSLLAAKKLRGARYKIYHLGELLEKAGAAGFPELGMEAAMAIPYLPDRFKGIGKVAFAIVNADAFKSADYEESRVARIDTDKDGKPDFFNPLATPEMIEKSGLVLDEDIDGDSILDTEDRRPYVRDEK